MDALLDRFMPEYDVCEQHSVEVGAPAAIVLDVASQMDLRQSRIIRAILRGRELILGSHPTQQTGPSGLIPFTKSIGWGVLAEEPDRQIVMGAITQPWESDVVFRSLPPAEFADHREANHVKIAWTLRADPVTEQTSIFRTETRAVACDAEARAKFLRYWRVFSPGIILIRRLMLGPVKRQAERRVAQGSGSGRKG